MKNNENIQLNKIRRAAVAGQFYPGSEKELRNKIDSYIEKVRTEVHTQIRTSAIIVPHAGYDYSGPVAAHTYKQLIDSNNIFL